MAKIRISALTSGSPAQAGDELPASRVPGVSTVRVTASSIAALTTLGNISGSLPASQISGTLQMANGGTGSTALAAGYVKSNAALLFTQTTPLPVADLGSGTPSSTTFLSGTGTWVSVFPSQTGKAGFVLGTDGTATSWVPPVVDPEQTVEIFEDFVGGDFFSGSASAFASVQGNLFWYTDAFASNTLFAAPTSNVGGVLRMRDSGTGTDLVGMFLNEIGFASGFNATQVTASKNPTVKTRWAQFGTGTGTRRVGLSSAAFSAGDPANGIYVRATNAGTLTGVCRSGGVESTLSLGSAAANGTFFTFRIVVTGTTSAEFFLNGTSKGTIVSNIPSAALTPAFGISGQAASQGLEIDYLQVVHTR